MVCGVSEKSYGIEFIYKCEVSDEDRGTFKGIKKYREELIQKYGKNDGDTYGLYAWDY